MKQEAQKHMREGFIDVQEVVEKKDNKQKKEEPVGVVDDWQIEYDNDEK
jgi:hypothetical protein